MEFIFHSWRLQSRISVSAELCSGETLLLVVELLPASLCVLTWWKGKLALWSLFCEGTNPIHEPSALMT